MSDAARALGALVHGQLDNGVSFAVLPDARDTVCAIQIWVRAGSSDEVPGATGLAHMLEHMMFRGSAGYPDGGFDLEMERLGASVNAATWLDYTVYTTTAPPEAVERVLEIEADRFTALALDADAFTAERDVVANERRLVVDSNPDALLSEAFHAAAFAGSSYAWPTIGWGDDISAFTREALEAFYRARYGASNLVVVVVGAVDVDHVCAAIARGFGIVGAGATRADDSRDALAPRARTIELRLPVGSTRLLLGWPGPARRDPRRPAWLVFNEVVAAAESSRLPVRLESADRLALDVSSTVYGFRRPSLFELSVTLRVGVSAKRARAAIDEELARLAEEPIEDAELDGAKARLRTTWAAELAETSVRAERLGEAWTVAGALEWAFSDDEGVADVTAAEVGEIARALRARRPWVAIGRPQRQASR